MNISIETPPKEVCHWLAGLVETAAPELGGLYVLDEADLPAQYRSRGKLGYTSPRLAMELQGHLEAVAQWHGARPAIVVAVSYRADLAAMAARHIGLTDAVAQFRARVAGTAMHEAGHVLTHGRPCEADTSTKPTQSPAEYFEELDAVDAPRAMRLGQALAHDSVFVRAAVHLAARANLDPIDVIGSGQPGNAAEYIKLLGDEPERLAGLPMHDVLATAAPGAFTEYFESSLRHWWHEQFSPITGKPFSKDLF